MTQEQQEQFKNEFKSIVYKKGLISDNETYLRNLHIWDKNDSHKASILQACEQRDSLKEQYNRMLKGRSYEEWKVMSKKLSTLTARVKIAIKRQKELEEKINQLEFNL